MVQAKKADIDGTWACGFPRIQNIIAMDDGSEKYPARWDSNAPRLLCHFIASQITEHGSLKSCFSRWLKGKTLQQLYGSAPTRTKSTQHNWASTPSASSMRISSSLASSCGLPEQRHISHERFHGSAQTPVERLLSSWKGPVCTSMLVGGRVIYLLK